MMKTIQILALLTIFILYPISNAQALAHRLQQHGFHLVTGGTDNHLILIDLTNKGVFGNEAEKALDRASICTNKNVIPFESRKPMDPSGLRLGTPAVTTRGMKEPEMNQIADLIHVVLSDPNNLQKQEKAKAKAEEICKKFPIYEGII